MYNLFWYVTVSQRYSPFTDGLERFRLGGYVYMANNNFVYFVSYPNYLTFTGNIVIDEQIIVPMDVNEYGGTMYEGFGSGLMIWPGIFNETVYRIIIFDQETWETRGAYVTSNREAIDPEDVEWIQTNQEEIDYFFDRAYARWGSID